YDPPELEFCISLAASIAKWMLDRGCPVGVFGNSEPSGPGAVHVPVASHPEQLRRVLETLALATPCGSVRRNRGTWWKGYVEADLRGAFVRPQLGQLLLREGSRLPFETSVAVVTAAVDAEVLTACRQLQRHRPLTVFYVQTPFGPARPDLRELHVVRVPYSEQWEDDERLQLAG
ncbi:MAG: hypothetical protein KGJ86_03555, partial [Chloroflexota bacterium]|nr:hypothetical protein [Chloroflexota bacterium]